MQTMRNVFIRRFPIKHWFDWFFVISQWNEFIIIRTKPVFTGNSVVVVISVAGLKHVEVEPGFVMKPRSGYSAAVRMIRNKMIVIDRINSVTNGPPYPG